ncbi:MAG: HD-GYP domain-containing protein [Acidobacteria bacterium]|nr:HD-GYP domain-containing protein [Acidobacteriota bacterium]
MSDNNIFELDQAGYRNLILSVGLALARAQELRDPFTIGHGANVSIIARKIAQRLNWDEDRIMALELAGLLHDIGKIAIPSEVLMKPSKLNDLEQKVVREHVQKGYDVLKDLQFPFPLAEIIYQHHEKLDGSGYPRGLKGNEILLEARILAVADILESLTVSRPYRTELSLYDVIDIIRDDAKSKLDPEIVDIAIEMIKESGDKFWS